MTWSCLSRHRGELMGLAMIFIVLFHAPLSQSDAFFGLRRCGNVGVDMFLLLSGMGLWFAWSKQPPLMQFYRRRLVRLLPAWLLVACLYYVPRFLESPFTWPRLFRLIGQVSVNIGFWQSGELTFWYIPAILALYLVSPFYMRLIEKHEEWRWLPVLMMVWCAAVEWVVPLHKAVWHLEILWSRVPIFFVGINLGAWVKEGRTLTASGRQLAWLTLVLTAALCICLEQTRHGRFPLFAERMVYIPMTVALCLVLCQLLERSPGWLVRAFSFIGGVSLETYLLHSQFVLVPLTRHHLGYWPTFLLTMAATLPLAWLLSKTIEKIRK